MWLGYTRVSKVGERGERLVSPELQAARIASYADSRGLRVEMLAPELDVSGGTLERPILGEALARIDRGEAEGIIVAQLDRLSRAGVLDTHVVLRRIEEAGGQVIAVAEDFDTSTPEGRMARNVMLSLGEMQREQRGAGFEAARRRAIERGIWPAAHVPKGYVKGEDRRLAPGPDAALILKAFEARAAGDSWRKVGEILGVTPSGAQWTIRNRVYLGEVRMKVSGVDVVAESAHPALVGRALFEAAQIEHPRPARGGVGPALLSGLIRCASCQRSMSPSKRAYNCTTRIPCETPASIDRGRVEPFVERVVLSHLASLRFAAQRRGSDLDDALGALADAEAELEAFQQATSASGVGVEAFAEGLRVRVAAVEEARGAVGRLRAREDTTVIAGAVSLWGTWDVATRRHALRGLLDVVWVRSAGRRTVDVSDRVKIVEAGFAESLVRQGVRSRPGPLVWETLPGELAISVEDVEED